MRQVGPFILSVSVIMLIATMTNLHAGNLDPSSEPSPTMYTLSEIYNKVDSLSTKQYEIPSSSIFDNSTGINATIVGTTQGNIEGQSTLAGRENTITVLAFEQAVEIPLDTATGLPTGERKHHPLSIIKYLDKASPKLLQMCATGEEATVTINFYRDNGSEEQHYYTIKLENAAAVYVKTYSPNLEKITFVFRKITYTEEVDGITYTGSF